MKKWMGVLTVAVLALLACMSSAAEKEKTEFTVGAHLSSTGGISSSQMFDMTNSLLKVFAEDYGYSIKMKKFSSYQDVARAFLENEIDVTVLGPPEILEIMDKGGEIYSGITYTVDKRRKAAWCLWQSKDNASKNISDVAGKRILTSYHNPLGFVQLRELLFTNGIDRPLWKVFDSFIVTPGSNSAFLALAMGDADFLWFEEDGKAMLKLINPGLVPKLSYNFCTGRIYARSAFIFNKKTVREADIKKLTKSLKEAPANLNEYAKTGLSHFQRDLTGFSIFRSCRFSIVISSMMSIMVL